MKGIRLGLGNFLTTKSARKIAIVSGLLLFLLTCLIQNGSTAFQVFSFNVLSVWEQIFVFFRTLFDLTPFGYGVMAVTILTSLLGGISLGMLYSYYKMRKDAFKAGGLALSGGAYMLALLGTQCTACGTALLTGFLTIFGGVWLNAYLPLHGLEIGILGIVIQIALIASLTKKLAYPNTC